MKAMNFMVLAVLIAVTLFAYSPCSATILTYDIVHAAYWQSHPTNLPWLSFPDGAPVADNYLGLQSGFLPSPWYIVGYGDYVAGSPQYTRRLMFYIEEEPGYEVDEAIFYYGVGTEGYTPNTRVFADNFNSDEPNYVYFGAFYQSAGYGDLAGAIYNNQSADTSQPPEMIGLNFYATTQPVILYDFDIAPFTIPEDANTWSVDVNVCAITTAANDGTTDDTFTKGAQLFSTTVVLSKDLAGHVSVPVNILRAANTAMRLEVSCATGGGGHIGIDNIRFGEQAALPATCSDPGAVRLAGDINGDCKVNFKDFAKLGSSWLSCNDPAGCP